MQNWQVAGRIQNVKAVSNVKPVSCYSDHHLSEMARNKHVRMVHPFCGWENGAEIVQGLLQMMKRNGQMSQDMALTQNSIA
jgi:hypothetical protein